MSLPTLEPRVASVHSEPLNVVLGPSGSFERQITNKIQFLEFKGIDWDSVTRARVFSFQQFAYVYPSLVTDLSQRLMVQPRSVYGDQKLLDFKLSVQPLPIGRSALLDDFGNAIIQLEVAEINNWTTFEVMFCVERCTGMPAPSLTDAEARGLTQATIFTWANPRMLEIASGLRMRSRTPLELAERICNWVSNTMTYKAGVTVWQPLPPKPSRLGLDSARIIRTLRWHCCERLDCPPVTSVGTCSARVVLMPGSR